MEMTHGGSCESPKEPKEAGTHIKSGSFLVDTEAMDRKTAEEFKKISNLQVKAFVTQFPFLTKYVNISYVKWVKLLPIDENFLGKKLINFCDGEQFILLNIAGEKLTGVGRVLNYNVPWYKSYPRSITIGEEIQYLEQLGKSGEVQFVLHIWSYGEGIEIYKPPKGFTIQEWVQEKIRRVSENLKKQLESIDKEGGK